MAVFRFASRPIAVAIMDGITITAFIEADRIPGTAIVAKTANRHTVEKLAAPAPMTGIYRSFIRACHVSPAREMTSSVAYKSRRRFVPTAAFDFGGRISKFIVRRASTG
jgi:hypothetical protein